MTQTISLKDKFAAFDGYLKPKATCQTGETVIDRTVSIAGQAWV